MSRNDPDFKAWQAADVVGSGVERRMAKRITELERRVTVLEGHGHAYAGAYGPGGEWDVTTGPVEAKRIT